MSSLLVSSRLSCISGKSSSSSSNKRVNHVLFNEPFPVSIKECKGYADVLSVSQDYDIYLDSSGLHWYLLVHGATGNRRPYISLEIVSNSLYLGKMIPTMRIIQAEQLDNLTRIFVDFTAKIIDVIHAQIHTSVVTTSVDTSNDSDGDYVHVADDETMNGGAFGIDIGAIVGAAIGSAVGGAFVGDIGTIVGGDVGAAIGGCGIGGTAIVGLIKYGVLRFKNSLAAIFC